MFFRSSDIVSSASGYWTYGRNSIYHLSIRHMLEYWLRCKRCFFALSPYGIMETYARRSIAVQMTTMLCLPHGWCTAHLHHRGYSGLPSLQRRRPWAHPSTAEPARLPSSPARAPVLALLTSGATTCPCLLLASQGAWLCAPARERVMFAAAAAFDLLHARIATMSQGRTQML